MPRRLVNYAADLKSLQREQRVRFRTSDR